MKIRAPQAIVFYRKYWDLVRLGNLNQIYREINHDIWYFVELYRLAKAGGFRVEHIVRLLRIAYNDLPLVECKYESLKTEINWLDKRKQDSARTLLDLTNQITELTNYVQHYRASCRREKTKLEGLRQKRMKREALVRQFENNNEEYTKIIKTAEEKVNDTLSKGKDLLKLAFLSLTESMRKDPEKYKSLIYGNMPSTTHYSDPQYPAYGYGFYKNGQGQDQSRNYSKKDYIDMLVEEAHKLQDMLVKDIVDETIDDYSTHLRISLPSLPPPDEDNV